MRVAGSDTVSSRNARGADGVGYLDSDSNDLPLSGFCGILGWLPDLLCCFSAVGSILANIWRASVLMQAVGFHPHPPPGVWVNMYWNVNLMTKD